MKKITIYTLALLLTSFIPAFVQAQAWTKSSTVLSVDVGLSQFYHLDETYGRKNNGNKRAYKLMTEELMFQCEFGISKYFGLGFLIGAGGRGSMKNDYNGELNFPVGLVSNFHFYQLIADNSKKNIHPEKFDIYGGLNIGSGVAFTYYTDENHVVPLFFGGAHVGIRYYLNEKFALNTEAGFGKNIICAGFSFVP